MPLTLSNSVKFSTEGAPMLIGDVTSAQHWNGREYGGSGIVVEYGGDKVERLPKEFAQTKSPQGKRQKKFTTIDEASAFESALLMEFKRFHPTAAKHRKYPGHPLYYVRGEGIFSIERRFTSPLTAMLKKLKGDVGNIPFDKKNKAEALFFDTEGGGSGVIAADSKASALVIAKVVTADGEYDKPLIDGLERTALKKVKPLGQIKLGGPVVVFGAAYAASSLAQYNFKSDAFQDGVVKALKSGAHGAIQVPDQKTAGGAFFQLKPDVYNYGIIRNERAGNAVYTALWLWPS